MEEQKYYKAFNKDLKCREMQYEIGKEYTFDGEPIPCQQGFHFCKSIADCYSFYDMSEDTRICEIKALGDVATDDDVKFCTNKILVVREVKNPREKSNNSPSCSGYWNSGNCNSGDRNSGNWNSGDWNSGDWNSGNWNSGIFSTEKEPKILIFDALSDWTLKEWKNSKAYTVMCNCPYTHSEFKEKDNMSDEEKERHPEYKTIGGYIRTVVVTDTDKQAWWDKLSDNDRQSVYNIPNFDAEKFKMCTGIEVEHGKERES